ncbi:MAG: hypothetical protein JNL08_13535 [Planctomycetes bacterium]|nr:hypothetical protein [Planctomycetota bacterium]
MRTFLVVLAAGVTAGLTVFFVFCNAMATVGDNVLMRTDVFVAFVAVLGIAASAVAVAFRVLLARSDEVLLRGLRERVARLEAAAGAAGPPAADPGVDPPTAGTRPR